MKNKILIGLWILFFLPALALAGGNTHYTNGVEGIRAATLPGPGVYYRQYNVLYSADTQADGEGKDAPLDLDLTVYANVHRFLWVTENQLLGGNIFMSATLPLLNTDISIGAAGVDDDRFGLGDINLEPFGLAWHGPRHDLAMGLSVFLPTGQYGKDRAASPGKGFWTGMLTLGGTLYLDPERTWSASVLSRYEVHSNRDGDDFRPGDDFHLEWGIGKVLSDTWEVGLAGYAQWQLTDDREKDAVNPGLHDRGFGIGPEVNINVPLLKGIITLRTVKEFGAVDRSEGVISSIVFTTAF